MIYGFWLLANGEKRKALAAPKEGQNIMIAVGHKDDPMGTINRSEIDDYLTPVFFRQYKIFERYKMGFGMPRGLSWDQQPDFIMDILETFQAEYKKFNPQG
jgi:hypothetical protein